MNLRAATIIFLFLAGVAGWWWSCRETIAWDEGHVSTSPDKRWCLYLESGRSDRQYARISVFDTSIYPELAINGTFPTARQSRNALARYIVPVNISARMTGFSWEGERVMIRQKPLNNEKSIAFTVDVSNYSLTAVE